MRRGCYLTAALLIAAGAAEKLGHAESRSYRQPPDPHGYGRTGDGGRGQERAALVCASGDDLPVAVLTRAKY
jgi:hypothetical protein